MLRGNPNDPHKNLSDYTEIVRESYKGYIGHLYQELVESIAKGSSEGDDKAVELFKLKLAAARRVNLKLARTLCDEDHKQE